MKNIIGKEQNYRNDKDETLHVFTDKGDIIKSIGGNGAEIKFKDKLPENAILTHNHPRSIGSTGISRIGNSFSKEDIVTAVKLNAKEIRAVTPTYTFSVKRPKGGWGGSAKSIGNAFQRASDTVFREGKAYLGKVGYSASNIKRAEITHFDKVMKKMSDKYEWDYSHKRG